MSNYTNSPSMPYVTILGTNMVYYGTSTIVPVGQTVNVVDSPSFQDLFSSGNTIVNNFSASTIFSGSVSLTNIFQQIGQSNFSGVNSINTIGNIFTGGTISNPIIGISNNPSFNNLIISGSENVNIISATTLSASTIISGSTNLYNIFQTIGSSGSAVASINSIGNIITGGTTQNPIINLVASPSINGLTVSGTEFVNIISATTLSASTIISGSTNLYNIFQTQGTEVVGVEGGSNITTGGTAQNPIINLIPSPSINNLAISGTANAHMISATTFIANIITSGATNLYNIFETQPQIMAIASLGF